MPLLSAGLHHGAADNSGFFFITLQSLCFRNAISTLSQCDLIAFVMRFDSFRNAELICCPSLWALREYGEQDYSCAIDMWRATDFSTLSAPLSFCGWHSL